MFYMKGTILEEQGEESIPGGVARRPDYGYRPPLGRSKPETPISTQGKPMKTQSSAAEFEGSLTHIYVARQPIFDARKSLFAYELLFRDSLTNMVPHIDGDVATSRLLSNSFLTIGLESLSGGNRVFINFTQNLLVQEVPALFPCDQTVVEILEDVKPEDEVIRACRSLSQKGYLLALDDFVFQAGMGPLVELADIIKVDFRQIQIGEIQANLNQLGSAKARLLAEKVETHEEFRRAAEMGFEYFQGYFFSRPEIVQGKEIPSSQIGLLKTIALVNEPDFALAEVEKLISQDLGIAYKLLRYINTAYFRRLNRIQTIQQALIILGEKEVRRFVSLLALSAVAAGKPIELIRNSFIRARFCELLGRASSCPETPDALFTIGLFSSINAVLDQPMEAIVEKLPLSNCAAAALVSRNGTLGNYLNLVESYEQGDWASVGRISAELCIGGEIIPDLYIEACQSGSLLPL
jgi:c-di-GMP-related signal transduction protein